MDRRTKKQKLQAMANQTVSPHEAEVAKQKLAEMKEEEKIPNHTINISITQSGVNVSFESQVAAAVFDFTNNRWVYYMKDGRTVIL